MPIWLGRKPPRGGIVLGAHGTGGGVAPAFTMSDLGTALGAYLTGKRAGVVSSAVTTIPSYGGGIGVYQATAANRGTISGNAVVFDGTNDTYNQPPSPVSMGDVIAAATTLPDAVGSVAGKGPTCTGLAQGPSGTWWVSDHGQPREDQVNTANFQSGLVKYSADFSTILLQVTANALGLGLLRSVQGNAYLPNQGQVAFAHCLTGDANSGVHLINEATGAYVGQAFGGAGISGLNGLAYDSSLDALIVHTVVDSVSTATWYARNAADLSAPIKTATLTGGADADHIHYDATRNWLWYSVGANGNDGLIYARDLTADISSDVVVFVARGARAVEGIVVTATEIVIANDGYYHLQTPALNQALRFAFPTIPALPPVYPTGARIGIWGVVKLTAALTASKPLIHMGGNPTTGTATGAVGMYFVGNASPIANQVRAFCNGANVTWTLPSGDFLTKKLFYLDIDMPGKTAELFIGGVSLGQLTFASGTALTLTQSKAYVASLTAGSPWFPGEIEALGYAAGTSAQTLAKRSQIQTFTAVDTSNTALLP